MTYAERFPWAETIVPMRLASPWWLGHIPFAYELIRRLTPRIVVELGTYSGSSFAAFCQAARLCGTDTRCYGVDLWEGDIHMGRFDEDLYCDIRDYVSANFAPFATLVRKSFIAASRDFGPATVDLLHIDGTHTYDAVSEDFRTWLPKMSDRGVVLFHDVNVTVDNAGPGAIDFGVRKFFDETKVSYPYLEFAHCWGLGMLVVGSQASHPVMELIDLAADPEFAVYFSERGEVVSRRFRELGIRVPRHAPYLQRSAMKRAVSTMRYAVRKAFGR